MEDQVKFCSKMSKIIGCVWCAFGLSCYFIDVFCKTLSGKYGLPILLCVHIAFFIFFFCSILFSYLAFKQNIKRVADKKLKEDDYQRKEKWEKFQYELNEPERQFRQHFELKKWEAERENNSQVFHLLAFALSDQSIFSDNKTNEEKLKQIEKKYELLKNTITNIKL